MRSFIHRKNLELYRKRLAEATDVVERETLAKLLEEEEAKFGNKPTSEGSGSRPACTPERIGKSAKSRDRQS